MHRGSTTRKKILKPFTRIKCPDCDAVPKDRTNWMRHRMTHSKEKPFACHLCDYRASVTNYLSQHLKKVHGDKLFKCPHPGCRFSSSWKPCTVAHLKGMHGTAKPFSCDVLGCRFRSRWHGSVSKHQKQVHSDDKPFTCDYAACSYSAKTKTHFIRTRNKSI